MTFVKFHKVLADKLRAMFTRTVLRRFTAWLAAVAVLCAGLLPLVSHAVVPHLSGSVGLVEVCTVSGMAWIKLDAASASTDLASPAQSDDTAPGMNMATCDWCALHSPHLGVPPAPVAMTLPAAKLAAAPPAFFHAPRPLFAWAAAQPRAPPVSA